MKPAVESPAQPQPATTSDGRADLDPPAARELRAELIASLVRDGELCTERVRRAMLRVPRHLFTSPRFAPSSSFALEDAYEDRPLPIGEGQTISQPAVVAWMTEALELTGDERILEIGTGSGYQAAVLALLARRVDSIERVPDLARHAAARLLRLGYANVLVAIGDGALGWPARAPFDRVIVTAAAPAVAPPWLEQLANRGILVAPLGGPEGQTLTRYRAHGGDVSREDLGLVSFVPLVSSRGP